MSSRHRIDTQLTPPRARSCTSRFSYAESAISFLNGQEMFRSRCREPLVSTVLTLAAGVYSLNIYQMDDGWEDALAMMYQGPDSGNQLVIIPSDRFMRPCLPSQWADPAANFRCISRPSPFNAGTGGCDGSNPPPNPTPVSLPLTFFPPSLSPPPPPVIGASR